MAACHNVASFFCATASSTEVLTELNHEAREGRLAAELSSTVD